MAPIIVSHKLYLNLHKVVEINIHCRSLQTVLIPKKNMFSRKYETLTVLKWKQFYNV